MVQLPLSLQNLLRHQYALSPAGADPVVGSGDEATIWRVATDSPIVVRVSPATRDVEQLVTAYATTLALAKEVPEVTSPIRAIDGSTVVTWNDRPLSVWPFIAGDFLDRSDSEQLASAADVLARLHTTGLRLLRPGRPSPSGAHLTGLVHGDFYGRNLLCRQRRVVGVIDWDDLRVERLDAELAWATWELAKSPAGDELIYDRAVYFISSYIRAGGPARPSSDFIQLIRQRLIGELDGDDPEYVGSLRSALQELNESRYGDLIRLGN